MNTFEQVTLVMHASVLLFSSDYLMYALLVDVNYML
jgi:hypothetical protein